MTVQFAHKSLPHKLSKYIALFSGILSNRFSPYSEFVRRYKNVKVHGLGGIYGVDVGNLLTKSWSVDVKS